MSRKILVTGGSGMIGTKLLNKFREQNTEIDFTFLKNTTPFENGHRLDISQKQQTISLITKINPDIVIHSAALANVDLCETNHKFANLINVKGTDNVIEGCKITKSKIVYISTSLVFDGAKDQYYENDIPCPATYYGVTKHLGETEVENSGLDYMILRTDQPYCWTEKWQRINSVTRVIQTLKQLKMLNEITDWYNNPTYVPNFVEAAVRLIEKNQTGIFHLVGSDYINRFDWSCIVADIFDLDKNLIKPITSESLNLPAKRKNINLNNTKTQKKTGLKMIGIREGAIEMKNNQKLFF